MRLAKIANWVSIFLLAIASRGPVFAAPKALPRPAIPAQQPPTVEHFATAAQALELALVTPARIVAFGEYHQTTETTKIPSSLARFTKELLPQVAKLATDLVVETWVADGRCGKQEDKIVEEVQTLPDSYQIVGTINYPAGKLVQYLFHE